MKPTELTTAPPQRPRVKAVPIELVGRSLHLGDACITKVGRGTLSGNPISERTRRSDFRVNSGAGFRDPPGTPPSPAPEP